MKISQIINGVLLALLMTPTTTSLAGNNASAQHNGVNYGPGLGQGYFNCLCM